MTSTHSSSWATALRRTRGSGLATLPSLSQGMCIATVGATPVNVWTWAASSIFSCGVRGTPGWANTLNRVPVFPKAQDGSSIRCDLRAVFTAVRSGISGHLQAADLVQHAFPGRAPGAAPGRAALVPGRAGPGGSVQVKYLIDPPEALVGELAAEVGEV